jgi:hypothetical protein
MVTVSCADFTIARFGYPSRSSRASAFTLRRTTAVQETLAVPTHFFRPIYHRLGKAQAAPLTAVPSSVAVWVIELTLRQPDSASLAFLQKSDGLTTRQIDALAMIGIWVPSEDRKHNEKANDVSNGNIPAMAKP